MLPNARVITALAGVGVCARDIGTERADADPIDGEIESDYAGDAEDHAACEIAARVAHFTCDEAGGLPTAISEEHGRERAADVAGGDVMGECGLCLWMHEKACDDQGRDGRDLQQHEQILDGGTRTHSHEVDGRKRHKSDRGDDGRRHGEARHFDQIVRERDGDRRHTAGLDDEQQAPSIEERDGRMPAIAQVGVLAADSGVARGEIGIDECARHGDCAAESPHAEDQAFEWHLARDHIGVHEDAAADDAAHDEHRDIEEIELARERQEVSKYNTSHAVPQATFVTGPRRAWRARAPRIQLRRS